MSPSTYSSLALVVSDLIKNKQYESARIILITALIPQSDGVAEVLHPVNPDGRGVLFAGYAAQALTALDGQLEDTAARICDVIVVHVFEAQKS